MFEGSSLIRADRPPNKEFEVWISRLLAFYMDYTNFEMPSGLNTLRENIGNFKRENFSNSNKRAKFEFFTKKLFKVLKMF